MTEHRIGGHLCKDPSCWCKIYPTEIKPDVVNNPSHYQISGLDIEALDVIRGVLNYEQYVGYLRGNILKYQIRANKKNEEEDLRKANYYSQELDKFLDGTYE